MWSSPPFPPANAPRVPALLSHPPPPPPLAPRSGGGFLIPFLLGVINMLYIETGVLKFDMPVAGASSGAICAT
jgi:hypothetical protein